MGQVLSLVVIRFIPDDYQALLANYERIIHELRALLGIYQACMSPWRCRWYSYFDNAASCAVLMKCVSEGKNLLATIVVDDVSPASSRGFGMTLTKHVMLPQPTLALRLSVRMLSVFQAITDTRCAIGVGTGYDLM